VHPERAAATRPRRLDRPLADPRGYAWSVPAGGEQRVGVGSYEPRDHVKEPTRAIAGRLGVDPGALSGQLVPARPAPGRGGRGLLRRRQRRALPAALGEGIRTAFYFGIACGRELRRVLSGDATREDALAPTGAFSAAHAPAFRLAGRLQKLIPALPPARAYRAAVRDGARENLADGPSSGISGWRTRASPPANPSRAAPDLDLALGASRDRR
jgi:flavin-dependent dehydrogenase